MATSKQFNNQIPGLVAGSSLAAKQYYPVKLLTTAGQVGVAAAQANTVISIVQNDPAAGEPALLPGVGDVCKAVAGANDIAIGDLLTANSSGVVDITTGFVFAQALEASAAVGNVIRVRIVYLEQA